MLADFLLCVRLVRRASMFAWLTVFAAPLLQPQDTLKLQFTGKLFGYYRIDGPQPGTPLAPVDRFLSKVNRSHLLIGMGDNFSPELGVRSQTAQTECRFADGEPQACNNVARFLETAGYRAIVPGREDFLQGARWLHDIASGFRQSTAHSANDDERLNLLAANLRVTLTAQGKATPSDSALSKAAMGCPLYLAGPAPAAKAGPCTTSDSLGVVTSSLESELSILDNWAQAPTNLSLPVGPTYLIRLRNSGLSKALNIVMSLLPPTMPSAEQKGFADLQDATEKLAEATADTPDLTKKLDKRNKLANAVFAAMAAPAKNQNCLPSAAQPLPPPCYLSACQGRANFTSALCQFSGAVLQAILDDAPKSNRRVDNPRYDLRVLAPDAIQHGIVAVLHTIAVEQKDIGYVETTIGDSGGKKALIVGIIGKETMQSVRPRNLIMCTPEQPSGGAPKFDWGNCHRTPSPGTSWLSAQVKVADPVVTAETLLRALDPDGTRYSRRILMAQMPRTEAEELASHIHHDRQSGPLKADFDLVVSEAQEDHASDDFDSNYPEDSLARVLTPFPPYSPNRDDECVLLDPLSTATLSDPKKGSNLRSLHHTRSTNPVALTAHEDSLTSLAQALFASYGNSPGPVTPSVRITSVDPSGERHDEDVNCRDHDSVWHDHALRNACEVVVMYRVLDLLRQRAGADTAMLLRRDFFFGPIPGGYGGYRENDNPHLSPQQSRLGQALDRVLWKGDAPARIMLSGKDLTTMLNTSEGLALLPSQLAARDVGEQWLQTTGIVTAVQNSPQGGLSGEAFSVPGDINCHDDVQISKPATGFATIYCINGMPIQPDHAYWIATSDHLQTDTSVYTTMSNQPQDYSETDKLSSIASLLSGMVHPGPQPPSTGITRLESAQQQQSLLHLDFGKLVLAYNVQQPSGGDANVSQNFQGVTDATAKSPSAKSLDTELRFRLLRDVQHPFGPVIPPRRLTFGIQSDWELTGTWTGSLNLTPPPPQWSYAQNSFTVGPFIQHAISFPLFDSLGLSNRYAPSQRSLPMLSLIIAPYQYQKQIRSVPLSISGASSSSAQITPRNPSGFSQRAGFRFAFDGGKWFRPDTPSYAELGMQYNTQYDVISALVIDGVNCPSSAVTYSQCAQNNNLVLSISTPITAAYATQKIWGGYWDISLQKGIGQLSDKSPSVKLVFESAGDLFESRSQGKAFSSQTRFDVPLNLSVTFPVFRNLTFAPTYQAYLYENQIAGNFLVVHSANVSLRWYLDRDSSVPFWRQFLFSGPGSSDQTQSSKK